MSSPSMMMIIDYYYCHVVVAKSTVQSIEATSLPFLSFPPFSRILVLRKQKCYKLSSVDGPASEAVTASTHDTCTMYRRKRSHFMVTMWHHDQRPRQHRMHLKIYQNEIYFHCGRNILSQFCTQSHMNHSPNKLLSLKSQRHNLSNAAWTSYTR